MNPDTKPSLLPTLTSDLLASYDIKIDNLFSTMWQRLGFRTLLCKAGFKKGSGTPVNEVVYLLMLWTWMKADSICRSRSITVELNLTSLRFCLLLFAKHEQGYERLSEVRNGMEERLCSLNFAGKLWGLFRAMIAGALSERNDLCSTEAVLYPGAQGQI